MKIRWEVFILEDDIVRDEHFSITNFLELIFVIHRIVAKSNAFNKLIIKFHSKLNMYFYINYTVKHPKI